MRIAAGGNDGAGIARGNGFVTSKGATGADGRDGLIGWDLVQQFSQHGGTGQSSPAILRRLATMRVAWRKGSLNTRFSVRQAWFAASEMTGWRPRLPVGADSHCILGSNQT